MSLNKTAGRLGVVTLAAMASSVVLAGTALAGPPHTVSVGSSTSGSHAYTAATKSPGVGFVVHNASGNVNMGCTSATAAGNILAGAVNTTTGQIGTIASSTWTGCVSVGLNMTVTQSSAWGIYMAPLTQSSGAALTNTITGVIKPVSGTTLASVKDTSTNGLLCKFDVVGAADGSFVESGQDLSVSETGGATINLKVANVSGCLGQIANNDLADFVATYDVTATGGNVNVY